MRPLMLFGWAWACLGTVDSDSIKIGKVGGSVVLKPSNVPAEVSSILWYHGPNFAAELIRGKKSFYGTFKDRSELDVSTGEFTIRKLTLDDADTYIPELNRIQQSPIELTVLESVKETKINVKHENGYYTLSCDGTIKDAGPVNYTWSENDVMLPNSSKEITVPVSTRNCSKFTCTIRNAVSESTSDTTTPCGLSSLAIALLAIGTLLAVLLVVIGIHRMKTKEWFYQKDATCWKADFWKDTKTQAVDGNGALPGEGKAMVANEDRHQVPELQQEEEIRKCVDHKRLDSELSEMAQA